MSDLSNQVIGDVIPNTFAKGILWVSSFLLFIFVRRENSQNKFILFSWLVLFYLSNLPKAGGTQENISYPTRGVTLTAPPPEQIMKVLLIFFQLNNPNVSASLVANQLVGLTDVKSGKPLYPGDLKLLVDVIGVLSQRGLGTSRNESSDASQTFVKVSSDDATKYFFFKLITKVIVTLSFWCFCISVNYYFQVSFKVEVILCG